MCVNFALRPGANLTDVILSLVTSLGSQQQPGSQAVTSNQLQAEVTVQAALLRLTELAAVQTCLLAARMLLVASSLLARCSILSCKLFAGSNHTSDDWHLSLCLLLCTQAVRSGAAQLLQFGPVGGDAAGLVAQLWMPAARDRQPEVEFQKRVKPTSHHLTMCAAAAGVGPITSGLPLSPAAEPMQSPLG